MFDLLDTVRTAKAIPAHGLGSHAFGTIIEVFDGGAAYLVEFCDAQGETLAMAELQPADIELQPADETPTRATAAAHS